MTSLDPAAPLRAALLDIDGTLADTAALISAALNEVLAEEGLKVSRDQFIAGWSLTAQDRMRLWTGDDDRARRLAGRYLNRYLALLDDLVRPYDGMQETLRALEAAGVALAVVTSKRRATAARTLGALDLLRYFNVVISEEDVTRPKPDPEPLALAASRLGVDPAAAVIIGDSSLDVRAGAAAGMRTAGALWGALDAEALRATRPTWLLAHPRDLLPLFGIRG